MGRSGSRSACEHRGILLNSMGRQQGSQVAAGFHGSVLNTLLIIKLNLDAHCHPQESCGHADAEDRSAAGDDGLQLLLKLI